MVCRSQVSLAARPYGNMKSPHEGELVCRRLVFQGMRVELMFHSRRSVILRQGYLLRKSVQLPMLCSPPAPTIFGS